jgi:hypothetical protein
MGFFTHVKKVCQTLIFPFYKGIAAEKIIVDGHNH